MPGARPSGRSGLDPDLGGPGGLQLDGRVGRAQGAHGGRELRAGHRHGAGVRLPGPRVPPPAAHHAAARGGRREGARDRPAHRGGPGHQRRARNAGRSAANRGGRPVRCQGWAQEAALMMLENNLHPDVAERPQDLVVYGGIGKAARDHASLRTIKRELQRLGGAETLMVQSGKPVAVFETHPDAPRVLIANSNLVPQWATWEHFRALDAAGLMMYGQMTAGSWIYIGTQGILQGTYETFAAVARKRFGGTLAGRLVLTAGLGGMGGAQPLAGTVKDGRGAAAGGDDERGLRAVRGGRPAPDRAPASDPLPRRARRRPRRGARPAR